MVKMVAEEYWKYRLEKAINDLREFFPLIARSLEIEQYSHTFVDEDIVIEIEQIVIMFQQKGLK